MSLKNKFNRVATDNSQLQEFANSVCDAFDSGDGEFKPVSSTTFSPYPSTWPTTGTTKAFCDAINADPTAVVAMAYLGEVRLSELTIDAGKSESLTSPK